MRTRAAYLLSFTIAVVFSIAGEAAPVASWQSPKTAEEYNNRGLDRQRSGDLDGAIADYTKALTFKAKPHVQATIYNNRAKVIELEPKFPMAYNERGNARSEKGDVEGAIADYSIAISLWPKSESFYYNRGIALQNQRQTDAAIKDFSEALKLTPSFYRTNINRAVAFFEKGDFDGAIADYSRALEFEEKDAALFYGRATALQKKNDLEGALADYTKTIELDPKHALAYANRGVVKVLLQKSEASADFEAAFRLDPSLKARYNEFYEKRRKP